MTPLLPLDDFRRILGWNPFHFWGLANADVPVTQSCPSVLKEYAWQHVDAAGRSEIRQAIESAEGLLRDYFGFAVAPEYREIEIPWARFADNARTRFGQSDATGRWIAPRLPGVGYVQAAGVESLALIGTAVKSDPPVPLTDTLVFTDRDGDSLDDTFTITMATTETDPDKIAVYFVAADRLDNEPVGARWRIQPAQVQIAGGVATIIGRLWLLVRPIKYQGVNPQPLDPGNITVNGPYAQSLDVYLRTTDPNGTTIDTSQATVVWETRPCHGWWCGCGCQAATYDPAGAIRDPAAIASATARVALRDAKLGILGIGEAVYNTTTGLWSNVPWDTWYEPDRITVRVYAGYPLENQAMLPKFQTVVARLAMAELARPVCACDTANRELHNWQFDLARSAGANDETFGYISREDLANPLGTRRGAVFAWKQIRNTRQAVGVTGF